MENKNFLLIFLGFIFLTFFSNAEEKVFQLPELNKPYGLYIGSDYIYFTDTYQISIYHHQDLNFFKKFGRKGEGPKEFKGYPRIQNLPDKLFVSSRGRAQLYSLKGEFQKFIKIPSKIRGISSVGGVFVGYEFGRPDFKKSQTMKIYSVYDKNFKKGAKFLNYYIPVYFSNNQGKQKLYQLVHFRQCAVYKNQIYSFDSSRGLFISVFNQAGEKLYEITRDYKKIKVTKDFINNWKNLKRSISKSWKKEIDDFEHIFPEFFPAIQSYKINQDKIYLITYKFIEENYEIIILDLKGNLIRKSQIPFNGHYKRKMGRHVYDIWEDKYYYLNENMEEDVWELHVVDF